MYFSPEIQYYPYRKNGFLQVLPEPLQHQNWKHPVLLKNKHLCFLEALLVLTAGKEKKNMGNLEASTQRPEEYILVQIVYIYIKCKVTWGKI